MLAQTSDLPLKECERNKKSQKVKVQNQEDVKGEHEVRPC